jgi:signal transduction histidine kinase
MKASTSDIDYSNVFRNAPAPFLLIAADPPLFTILDANEAYLAATLTSLDRIRGKGIFEAFPDNPDDPNPQSCAMLRGSLKKVIASRQPHELPEMKYDVPLQNGGFEVKYWKPLHTPIFAADGSVTYILQKVQDVTAQIGLRRTMTADAEKAAAEIEEKSTMIKESSERINVVLEAMLRYTTMDFSEKLAVSERGDELDAIIAGLNSLIEELDNYTNLLKRANKDLENANAELDSFSYSVSHDLRAPLRAINGYSQLLLEDCNDQLDDNGKKIVTVIIRNAAKMGALIDDLLKFARVAKQNLTRVELNMEDIVKTVMRDFEGESEFRLNTILPARGDGSMLQQVWANLVSNAVKYSRDSKEPFAEIGSYNEGPMNVYYIKDNGTGFNMKYYDKLFGVFQRLHSPSQYEGTGVGLALVQRIVRKHGGEVWAHSVEGEGATFYFSLPLI